jgi:cysteine desulfurase / selenocysteine lyase
MAIAERKPLDSYRDLFPVTRERIYFNHAANGTLATPVVEAMTQHLLEFSRYGSDVTSNWKVQKQRTREKMASFVGADPMEIAIGKNTPEALSIIASGFSWQPGDRVVISDLEFPGNAFPWLNLTKRGVETTIVRSRAGCIPTHDVIQAIDERTRLVALSWVEFSNGYRNDLRTIGQPCHKCGALLAVDAIQGLGALRFNVRELNVDFFGAASHKWLLGPTGVGWLFCRRDLIEQIDVTIIGQKSYDRGEKTSLLDYNLELWPDARRFEPGKANSIGTVGLEATLDLLVEVGIDRIEAQVKHLTDRLAEGLLERGFRLAAPRDGDQWSGIVSFSSNHYESKELFQRLTRSRVSVSLREGLIRLSPHFYNNDDDVERFFKALG